MSPREGHQLVPPALNAKSAHYSRVKLNHIIGAKLYTGNPAFRSKALKFCPQKCIKHAAGLAATFMSWKYTPMSDQSQFDILIPKSIDDWGCDDDILMQHWFASLVCWSTTLEIGLSMPRRPPCWLLIHFIEMYSAAELNISNDKKWLAQLVHQCMGGVLVPKMWGALGTDGIGQLQ